MKIKIGIITFHRAQNYGAVLQCYALSEYLNSLGCNVEVIDYYPKVFLEEYASFPKAVFRRASFLGKMHILVTFFGNLPYTKKREKVFDDFIHKELNLSSIQYNDTNQQIGGYDVLFFGSDQIWNPNLTGGFDDVFTGNFNKGITRFVSYAASTMMDSVAMDSKEYVQSYRSILKRFDMVSVRERAFADYLNNLNEKNVELVIDPVLLLDKDNWSKIAVRPREERYLLLYSVPRNSVVLKKAHSIAQEKGLKLIEIASNGRMYIDDMYKQMISPEEYVGLFQYADFIVTSSFHGTAFSVIYKKPFVFFKKGNNYDGRAYGLLKELNLTSRAFSLDSRQISSDVLNNDYVDCDSLVYLKEKSVNYLKKALEEY